MAKRPVRKKPAARSRARRQIEPAAGSSDNGHADGPALALPAPPGAQVESTPPPPLAVPPRPPRSTAAVASCILGLFGYVPIIPGFLAIIFGYIGIMRTRGGRRRGRLLALAGLAMGILSVLSWGVTIELAMVAGGFTELASLVWPPPKDAPRAAAEQWLRDLCAGQPQATDAAAAESAPALPRALFDAVQKQFAPLGPLQAFTPAHYHFSDHDGTEACTIEASASFAGGQTRSITIALVDTDYIWKVRDCQAR